MAAIVTCSGSKSHLRGDWGEAMDTYGMEPPAIYEVHSESVQCDHCDRITLPEFEGRNLLQHSHLTSDIEITQQLGNEAFAAAFQDAYVRRGINIHPNVDGCDIYMLHAHRKNH